MSHYSTAEDYLEGPDLRPGEQAMIHAILAVAERLEGLSQPCPTHCDPDCDSDCHEAHQPPHKRTHPVGDHQGAFQPPLLARGEGPDARDHGAHRGHPQRTGRI